ncbi:hypothetical protein BDV29DRAFT_154206 [Aspergillus leporis]|uniref:RING-type domain-containing protein n=1 Tax=Aspergillus leporis TaxID=41062 RepID=A0A5N5XA52_9EURO|nr:hypothetical protein BDV29DRAFT_154206 [Aspergillus leporis]
MRSLESRVVDTHVTWSTGASRPWTSTCGSRRSTSLPSRAFFSAQTCLGCLRCSPQHALACGHAHCDACVKQYGRPQPREGSTYVLEACPLCRQPCLVSVALLPQTAVVRALTVDGGGIRGIISFQVLLALQDLLGLHCPLRPDRRRIWNQCKLVPRNHTEPFSPSLLSLSPAARQASPAR